MKRTIEKAWKNREEMLKDINPDPKKGIVRSRRTGESVGVLHKRGYVLISKRVNGKHYKVKRSNIIWWSKYKKMPHAKMDIDHIDGDRANDRIENLQILTHQQNLAKRKKNRNGSSKYRGVRFHKKTNKFIAEIEKYGKKYHFGYHENEKQAAIARDRGMIKLYEKEMKETGFLPPLNFPGILQENSQPLQLELF
ncbi:MAG: hypothetical protein EBU08_18995 [Micrococcales bacterium]|nr:hypothetical protein [Micrococcales bacterium]